MCVCTCVHVCVCFNAGRVSDWLGPKYFNDDVDLTSGCRVRLLKQTDKAKFRNSYEHTCLGMSCVSAYTHTHMTTHVSTPAQYAHVRVVQGTAKHIGSDELELTVRQNWGLRVVVRTAQGAEKVCWGHELHRCSDNPHSVLDPYGAHEYHKWNRKKLRKLKAGSIVQYHLPPKPGVRDTSVWVQVNVLRTVRGGCWQNVKYSVQKWRCLHELSVRLTKRMIERARRDNRLWGAGLLPPVPVLRERHIVSPETYKHLREWIYSPDFLEPLKATEQATQQGHCFAVREAIATTFTRYQKHAQEKEVEHVSERVYRYVPRPMQSYCVCLCVRGRRASEACEVRVCVCACLMCRCMVSGCTPRPTHLLARPDP